MKVELVAVALMAVLVHGFPQQPVAPNSAGSGNGVLGSTYDEIVVETQLAVRPKAPSAGLRLGRAKPVFFRPNATTSTTSTTSAPSTTTPGDGLTFAARVVGVENPLAAKARASSRSRRASPEGATSGSSGGRFHSSYFRSSSSHSSSSGQTPGGLLGGLQGGERNQAVSFSAVDEFQDGPHGPTSASLRAVFLGGH